MIRSGRFIVTLVVFAILGTTIVPMYIHQAWQPDLFALLVILAAVRARPEHAIPLAWGVGLVRDVFSAGPLGEYAFLYLAVGFLLSRERDSLALRIPFASSVVVFIIVLATQSVYALISSGFHPRRTDIRYVLGCALITAIIAPFVLHWVENFARPRKRGLTL